MNYRRGTPFASTRAKLQEYFNTNIALLKQKMGAFSGSCGNDMMNFVDKAFGAGAWRGKPMYEMRDRYYRNPHKTMVGAPRDYAKDRGGNWYWIIHDPSGGRPREIQIRTGMIIHVFTGYQYEKDKAGQWQPSFSYGHWLMFAIKSGRLYVFDSLARQGRQFSMSGGWAHQQHGRFREYSNDAWVGGGPSTSRARTTGFYDPPASVGSP